MQVEEEEEIRTASVVAFNTELALALALKGVSTGGREGSWLNKSMEKRKNQKEKNTKRGNLGGFY